MPYVKQDRRPVLDSLVVLLEKVVRVDGDLNYILFALARRVCERYADFKNFRGELMETHNEIGRRLLAPYEDKKIKENGDVF